jgi:hypothetical protein
MTEEEWLGSADPLKLLEVLGRDADARKLRLFACACCRQVWNPFVPPLLIRAVTAAEAQADDEVSLPDLLAHVTPRVRGMATEPASGGHGYLTHVAVAVYHACRELPFNGAQQASLACARAAADLPLRGLHRAPHTILEYVAERAAQADLLRDIFGNPFRSLEIRSEWLTADVVALARGIYADRAFDRLPILADALQDAGCADEDVLGHCRAERGHVRGCWVVDLLK